MVALRQNGGLLYHACDTETKRTEWIDICIQDPDSTFAPSLFSGNLVVSNGALFMTSKRLNQGHIDMQGVFIVCAALFVAAFVIFPRAQIHRLAKEEVEAFTSIRDDLGTSIFQEQTKPSIVTQWNGGEVDGMRAVATRGNYFAVTYTHVHKSFCAIVIKSIHATHPDMTYQVDGVAVATPNDPTKECSGQSDEQHVTVTGPIKTA